MCRLLFALSVLVIASCVPTWTGRSGSGTGNRVHDDLVEAVLTPDGDDWFVYERSGPDLSVSAHPDNDTGNLRVAFWPASAPTVTDGESCATWTDQTRGRNVQQGAALRISTDADGVTRAVTVTKNIYFGFNPVFNFHVWKTGTIPASNPIGRADMRTVLGGKPFPWHLCARTRGTSLTVKVWAGDEPEPAWGRGPHVASVTLDPEWVYPGTSGWYIGHIPPDGFADFTDLTIGT